MQVSFKTFSSHRTLRTPRAHTVNIQEKVRLMTGNLNEIIREIQTDIHNATREELLKRIAPSFSLESLQIQQYLTDIVIDQVKLRIPKFEPFDFMPVEDIDPLDYAIFTALEKIFY